MSQYTEQADKFLADHSLTFRAVFVGEDCPTFCEDAAKGVELIPGTFPRRNHIHGSHWRLTISGEKRGHLTVDFWDSYQDAETRALGCKAYRDGKTHRKYGTRLRESHEQGDGLLPKAASSPKPTAYDMLAVLTKSDPETFEDFCLSYGYDSDSRRAHTIYEAVVKEYRQVSRFFTAEEFEQAQEIQ